MILCIDDDPTLLQLEKAVLEAEGFVVATAPDGATGLALLDENWIEAVVVDFDMAGIDGGQVAEAIMLTHGGVPVLMFTGSLDLIPDSLRWFADVVIDKGSGPQVLISHLKRLLAPRTQKPDR